jgi:predicted transcriptional regulator
MPEILISIKPKYLDLILSSRKTVELRKQSTRIPPGSRLLLYASSPRRAIVGEARVSFREELAIEVLWAKYGAATAIGREEFDAYYASADSGVALGLIDVRSYPSELPLHSLRAARKGFRPPQSYMRVPGFIDALLRKLLGRDSDARGGGESQCLLPIVVPAE